MENARSWIYGAVTVLVLALCVYVSYVVPSVLDVLGFVGGVAGVSLMSALLRVPRLGSKVTLAPWRTRARSACGSGTPSERCSVLSEAR